MISYCSLLRDTRDLAENALRAANAYQDIVDAIDAAEKAAKAALNASKEAKEGVSKSSFGFVATCNQGLHSIAISWIDHYDSLLYGQRPGFKNSLVFGPKSILLGHLKLFQIHVGNPGIDAGPVDDDMSIADVGPGSILEDLVSQWLN